MRAKMKGRREGPIQFVVFVREEALESRNSTLEISEHHVSAQTPWSTENAKHKRSMTDL